MTADVLTGVWPAVTVPFDADLALDTAAFADHCRWLVESGCDGVVVNGSLGEYEALTDDERRTVVRTAIDAVGAERVIPGVAGKGALEAAAWTRHAADLGVAAVMCLPPTSHAPTPDEVVAHYAHVGQVGVPVIAYNNPWSTRVDLTPELLARIAREVPAVRGVKEFSQDVRRVLAIADLAPDLQVICGCDDVLVESVLVGARGWIAGFVNAFPAQSVALHRMALDRDVDGALDLYREMLPILRWDADPRFVQAIKLGQEEAGRYGGPCRLPRLALPAEEEAEVRAHARRALAAGSGT
ncbi:dihydrodipicolinate synthase family protein [Euzebya sp.]|uniref:dihydrodipicolinate synthase family protein n=1 Tax=Euzebya sp. TaxID=1971409 RepID=UPI003512FF19